MSVGITSLEPCRKSPSGQLCLSSPCNLLLSGQPSTWYFMTCVQTLSTQSCSWSSLRYLSLVGGCQSQTHQRYWYLPSRHRQHLQYHLWAVSRRVFQLLRLFPGVCMWLCRNTSLSAPSISEFEMVKSPDPAHFVESQEVWDFQISKNRPKSVLKPPFSNEHMAVQCLTATWKY